MEKASIVKHYGGLFLKGIGMGAANIIPGVSGGTIALITGIFETLIHSLKSFNLVAIKLFFTGKWKALANHINLGFLIAVFSGVAISIYSLAKVLGYLFENYPVLVWAFFFGLIIASVYYVGKTISHWRTTVWISFITGTAIAVVIAMLKPAQQNEQTYYLVICGVIAICSMILPGLSGSFVLLLLGNYQLVMIDAVRDFNLGILVPVITGAIFGLLAFSHLLSWIFKKYKDVTISMLTGFMLGSLLILWPWKESIFRLDTGGNPVLTHSGKQLLEGYRYLIPSMSDTQTYLAILCILTGAITIVLLELQANRKISK